MSSIKNFDIRFTPRFTRMFSSNAYSTRFAMQILPYLAFRYDDFRGITSTVVNWRMCYIWLWFSFEINIDYIIESKSYE